MLICVEQLFAFFSDGEEINPEDNINNIYHPLIHEADILFTR